MNCERAAQVHALHDGALAASDAIALEVHLADCADCRELLSDLRGLSRLIDAAPRAAISPAALTRIVQVLRAAHERGVLRITSWLTAAAAAVLVGALGFWPERESSPISGPNTSAQAPVWQTFAVMPPPEAQDENAPELALALWMANDLAVGERQ